MGIKKPYKRTARVFTDGHYSYSGKSWYIEQKLYADNPGSFVRGFNLLQKDLLTLFDYVEPSEYNIGTHSYRIHELLIRACIEVEANFTAILRENGYSLRNESSWDMRDYKKVEQSHYLSMYQVLIPNWRGSDGIFTPFSSGSNNGPLSWYQAYNKTKHDRHINFELATFEKLINAFSGLAVLLAAQFLDNTFSGGHDVLVSDGGGIADGFIPFRDGLMQIKYPVNIPEEEKYDFDHQDIDNNKDNEEFFQKFNYN